MCERSFNDTPARSSGMAVSHTAPIRPNPTHVDHQAAGWLVQSADRITAVSTSLAWHHLLCPHRERMCALSHVACVCFCMLFCKRDLNHWLGGYTYAVSPRLFGFWAHLCMMRPGCPTTLQGEPQRH